MSKEVLVIDDDKSNRDTLRLIFSDEGFTVSSAANGWQALDLIHKRLDRRRYFLGKPRLKRASMLPDLVVTDWKMKDLSGVTLASMLREIKKDHIDQIPVMLLSAMASEQIRLKEPNVDKVIDRILPKPFEIDDLLNTASELIYHNPRKAP